MEHNTCRENMSAYLDNELSEEEKLLVESHLALCPGCSRQLEELKLVSTVFKKHAMQPVPPALKEAVLAGKSEKPFFSGWLKPAAVLSAAAAGLLILFALPEFRRPEGTLSPSFFSGANYAEEAPESSGGSFAASAGGGRAAPVPGDSGAGAKRYAVPELNTRGAYGQAKFAGRGASGAPAAPASLPGTAGFNGISFVSIPAAESAAQPAWVDALIRRYKAGPAGNPPFAVWEFSYKGKKVYYLPPQCCDQYSGLYDEKGERLCAPDGGLGGRGDGKCADFYDLRTSGKLLWQDQRGR